MNSIRRSSSHHSWTAPIVGTAAVVALLSGCAQWPKAQTETQAVAQAAVPEPVQEAPPEPAHQLEPEPPPPKPSPLYQWNGDGRRVSRIDIDVDEQKAVFYDGSQEVGWTRVASGLRSFPTPTGQFTVREKVADKRSNIYGKIYNSKGQVVRKNAELGVHPIPPGGRFEGAEMPYFLRLTNDGIGLHGGSIPRPGRPASHGCIRLPRALAPVLYSHVGVGTTVSIVGSGPSYETYLAQQARKAAKRRPPAAPAETVVAAAGGASAAAPAGTAETGSPAPEATTSSATTDAGPAPVAETPPAPASAAPTETPASPAAQATVAASGTDAKPAPPSTAEAKATVDKADVKKQAVADSSTTAPVAVAKETPPAPGTTTAAAETSGQVETAPPAVTKPAPESGTEAKPTASSSEDKASPVVESSYAPAPSAPTEMPAAAMAGGHKAEKNAPASPVSTSSETSKQPVEES